MSLDQQIIRCRLCPRLVHFRETVPIRHQNGMNCWRKPVPGFGDPNAFLLILGLAPSIEGANRTGRIFTGDASAQFLIKNLYQAGFANQEHSLSIDDHLQLKNCYLTAVVKCTPPKHRPTLPEIQNCSRYLDQEIQRLKNLSVVLVLGRIAFQAYKNYLVRQGISARHLQFQHGARYEFENQPALFASYHPSPQNTCTGVLTERAFQEILKTIQECRKTTPR